MAGRPPKPTAVKLAEGNPGKRPLNRREPTVAAKMPSCPAWLGGEARREWRRLAKELHAANLLASVDRAALAAYCQLWARWVAIEEELVATVPGKDGQPVPKYKMVGSTDKGYEFVNPLYGLALQTLKAMKQYMVEFGMTPSSRSRIRIDAPQEEKSLAEILFEGVMQDMEN